MLILSKMNDRNWLTIDLILSNNHDHYISWFVLGYRLSWPWPLNGWVVSVVSGHKTNVYLDARMFIQACHWWILHMVANDFSLIIFHIVIKNPQQRVLIFVQPQVVKSLGQSIDESRWRILWSHQRYLTGARVLYCTIVELVINQAFSNHHS